MGLKRTHLYNFHSQQGHLTTFAGFEHVLWYKGVIPEHMAVRNAVGLFDVSHMGRCMVRRHDPQPMEPETGIQRVVGRGFCGDCGRARPVCDRHGNMGIDRIAVHAMRRDRTSPDVRAREPRRGDGVELVHG